MQARACLHLALILPRYEDEPQLIAIPMSCTMGWVQSPPTFCTVSETICDRANQLMRESPLSAAEHRLEEAAAIMDDTNPSWLPCPCLDKDTIADKALADIPGVSSLPVEAERTAPPSNRPLSRPLAQTDVFIDDFIQLVQGRPKHSV